VGMIELGLVLIPYQTCPNGQTKLWLESTLRVGRNLWGITLPAPPKHQLPKEPPRDKADDKPSDAAKRKMEGYLAVEETVHRRHHSPERAK